LFEQETRDDLEGYEKGAITQCGAVAVDTGIFTGRSPKDKYIVRDDTSRDTVWWSDQGKNDNKPIDKDTWDHLKSIVAERIVPSGKLFSSDDVISSKYFLARRCC